MGKIMKALTLPLAFAVLLISAGGCAVKTESINRTVRVPAGISPVRKRRLSPVAEQQKTACRNASSPLLIRTYDGSNQANHPKVLKFSMPWNGYLYWMSYTPYPGGNASDENPSVEVSNDGINWVEPRREKNPVVKPPLDVSRGGHNSDPDLVVNGRLMELWYRYNPANKKGGTSHSINCIYRVISRDGVRWSKPQLIFRGSCAYFSPAVVYDGRYEVWYTDTDGRLHYRQCSVFGEWSAPVTADLPLPGYCIWHQDVIKDGNVYRIVFSAFKKGEFSKNNQQLYYADSPDGIHFGKPLLLLAPSEGKGHLDNQMIYRSSIVPEAGGSFDIYYSAMAKNRQWHIFRTVFKLSVPDTRRQA